MPKFEEHALLERVDGDIEFLAETVQMLDEDCVPLIKQIQEAAAARDAYALEKTGSRFYPGRQVAVSIREANHRSQIEEDFGIEEGI